MGDPSESNQNAKAAKEDAKVRKKLVKAQAKAAKKGAAGPTAPSAPPPPSAPSPTTTPGRATGPSPAERSAAAAEKQVRLQRFRIWIAALTLLVALVTFLATAKPWQRRSPPEPDPRQPVSQPAGP